MRLFCQIACLAVFGLASAILPPFHLPCTTITTVKGPQITLTVYDVDVDTTKTTLTVTKAAKTVFTTTSTTSFSKTDITCFSSATTLKGHEKLLPRTVDHNDVEDISIGTLTIPGLSISCPTIPPITVYPPTATGKPCTAYSEPIVFVTSTKTKTITKTSTATATRPTKTLTRTHSYVQPTPSLYGGLKYYQYINDYDYYTYPTSPGYGGGFYETSDWNGNKSYLSSGFTKNIRISTPDYPSSANLNCQLPGQAAPSDCQQWTVVYQGFLFSPSRSGNFTVNLAPGVPVDNECLVWGGEKAYSKYTNDDSDIVWYVDGRPTSGTYELVQGEAFPMTFIYSDGGGPALNNLTITDPDGVVYPVDTENFFVPPCKGSLFVP